MKAIIFVSLVLFIAFVAGTREDFENFKRTYSKKYKTAAENEYRYRVFESNLEKANKLNTPESLARFGVTKFMDMTPAEFKKQYLMPELDLSKLPMKSVWEKEAESKQIIRTGAYPTTFDWSSKGMVTAVKNQEQCGSCWAFSATETIESVYAITKKKSPATLSPQQIVDCDTAGEDQGCDGGYPYGAYEYIIQAGGQESESDYPYTGEDGTCEFKKADIVDTITNWKYVTQSSDEKVMQAFVYTSSPISVCVDAEIWQTYQGGVITSDSGCGNSLDHCVQITGWLTENSTACWNVRNSWGADWGENGYIWVERGADVCGIADLVTIPIVN